MNLNLAVGQKYEVAQSRRELALLNGCSGPFPTQSSLTHSDEEVGGKNKFASGAQAAIQNFFVPCLTKGKLEAVCCRELAVMAAVETLRLDWSEPPGFR